MRAVKVSFHSRGFLFLKKYSRSLCNNLYDPLFFFFFLGRGVEESHFGGVCKQAGHGTGHDSHRNGKCTWLTGFEGPKMADIQNLCN